MNSFINIYGSEMFDSFEVVLFCRRGFWFNKVIRLFLVFCVVCCVWQKNEVNGYGISGID